MKETLMNMIRNSVISLSLVLLATPVISGQDLSRYRKFVLGTSLASISKQVGKDESLATLISQSPALIQQMTYWQADTSDNSGGMEPISHITLDFYNGAPYRILQAGERPGGGCNRRIRETREGTGTTKGNRPPDKGSRRPGYRAAEEHQEFSPIVRLGVDWSRSNPESVSD